MEVADHVQVQIDVTTMKEQRVIDLQNDERGCTLFRSNDRFLFSADMAGKVMEWGRSM